MNFKDKEQEKKYVAQLQTMWENAEKWRKENPETVAMIAWNYPAGVALVAPISEAIKKGFVRHNAAGLELLKALWPTWEDETEPTVIMCRAVLELEPKK